MDMDTKELSNEVSVALDILGFRQEMIKWRRYSYLRHSDAISNCVPPAPASLCGLNFKPVLTGSKKEGTSIWHQSDEDFMLTKERAHASAEIFHDCQVYIKQRVLIFQCKWP